MMMPPEPTPRPPGNMPRTNACACWIRASRSGNGPFGPNGPPPGPPPRRPPRLPPESPPPPHGPCGGGPSPPLPPPPEDPPWPPPDDPPPPLPHGPGPLLFQGILCLVLPRVDGPLACRTSYAICGRGTSADVS